MKLWFDPAFDGPSWPGVLGARDACSGEDWVGPLSLLSRLETAVGLGGVHSSNAERAAGLISALRETSGYWSESLSADEFSTARRLLRDRDTLWLAGWRGQAATGRLGQLAQATRDALPGLPDRLDAVAEALSNRNLEIESICVFEDAGGLALGWRRVFDRLERLGVTLESEPQGSATATGDLGGAQGSSFVPGGDGTLQLLRPYGPAEAAEELAVWLAARPSLDGMVIVGPDAALDAALHQYGLPTAGVSSPGSEHLAVLPLVLELAWSPQDPQQAYELLLIPQCPAPRAVGARLVRALQRWPSTNSENWRSALNEALEAIENSDRRRRLESRIRGIFEPGPSRESDRYPLATVKDRTKLVHRWAEAHRQRDLDAGGPFGAVSEQCSTLLRLVETAGINEFSANELRRWFQLATEETRKSPEYPAEAGLTAVGRPDAVAGPVRVVVWWNFHHGTAQHPGRLPWSRVEQEALKAIGVELPDRGTEALQLATRWRRPLIHVSEALVLVCPRRGPDGEELHPHPLWDEIQSKIPEKQGRRYGSNLVRSRMDLPRPAERPEVEFLRIPTPRRVWRVEPGRISLRENESPSSLESLLGCSLQWSLRYAGKLRCDLTEPPSGIDNRLLGSLAHEVLRLVLQRRSVDPEQARSDAERLFDETLGQLAVPLLLPGAEAQRGEARHCIGLAARSLIKVLAAGRLAVSFTEEARSTPAFGSNLRGTPDVVLKPSAIIDYKWGSRDKHRRALENGTAAQLAAYARMVAEDPSMLPAVAYLIVRSQDLLTTNPELLPGSISVSGPTADVTWAALERAGEARGSELRQGQLEAPGNPDDNGEVHATVDAIVCGKLDVAPGCRFCDYSALCGLLFAELM